MVGEQQVGKPDDRRQHIIEIMRNTPGKLTDRLHLLTLGDLFLQHLLLGGVDPEHQRRLAGLNGAWDRAEQQPPILLAFHGADIDRRNGDFARRRFFHRLTQAVAHRLFDQLENARMLQAFHGAEKPSESGIAVGDRAILGERSDRDRGRFQNAEKLVRVVQFGGGTQIRVTLQHRTKECGFLALLIALMPCQQDRDGQGRAVAPDKIERRRDRPTPDIARRQYCGCMFGKDRRELVLRTLFPVSQIDPAP